MHAWVRIPGLSTGECWVTGNGTEILNKKVSRREILEQRNRAAVHRKHFEGDELDTVTGELRVRLALH